MSVDPQFPALAGVGLLAGVELLAGVGEIGDRDDGHLGRRGLAKSDTTAQRREGNQCYGTRKEGLPLSERTAGSSEDGRASEENTDKTPRTTVEAAMQLDSHRYETQKKWGTRRR